MSTPNLNLSEQYITVDLTQSDVAHEYTTEYQYITDQNLTNSRFIVTDDYITFYSVEPHDVETLLASGVAVYAVDQTNLEHNASSSDAIDQPTEDMVRQILESPTKEPKHCSVCNQSFATKRLLQSHIKIHEADKPLACMLCSERFNFAINLEVHCASKHADSEVGPFLCTICSTSVYRFSAFCAHLKNHQRDDTLPCLLCEQTFESQCLLDAHLNEHKCESAAPTRYRCRYCIHVLDSLPDLRKHYSHSHKELINLLSREKARSPSKNKVTKEVTLLVKRKPSVQMSDIELFIRKVSPAKKDEHSSGQKNRLRPGPKKRTFSCPECTLTFKKECLLQRHILRHTGSKPFECIICKATFSQKSSAKTHILSKHYADEGYTCPICQRNFNYHGNLVQHFNLHKLKQHNSTLRSTDNLENVNPPGAVVFNELAPVATVTTYPNVTCQLPLPTVVQVQPVGQTDIRQLNTSYIPNPVDADDGQIPVSESQPQAVQSNFEQTFTERQNIHARMLAPVTESRDFSVQPDLPTDSQSSNCNLLLELSFRELSSNFEHGDRSKPSTSTAHSTHHHLSASQEKGMKSPIGDTVLLAGSCPITKTSQYHLSSNDPKYNTQPHDNQSLLSYKQVVDVGEDSRQRGLTTLTDLDQHPGQTSAHVTPGNEYQILVMSDPTAPLPINQNDLDPTAIFWSTFNPYTSQTEACNPVEAKPLFGCAYCDASFPTANGLNKHNCADCSSQQRSQSQRKQECSTCGKSFAPSAVLLCHELACSQASRLSAGPFWCPFCQSEFRAQSRLTRHLLARHPAEVDPVGAAQSRFRCRHCNQTFGRLRLLKAHIDALDICATNDATQQPATGGDLLSEVNHQPTSLPVTQTIQSNALLSITAGEADCDTILFAQAGVTQAVYVNENRTISDQTAHSLAYTYDPQQPFTSDLHTNYVTDASQLNFDQSNSISTNDIVNTTYNEPFLFTDYLLSVQSDLVQDESFVHQVVDLNQSDFVVDHEVIDPDHQAIVAKKQYQLPHTGASLNQPCIARDESLERCVVDLDQSPIHQAANRDLSALGEARPDRSKPLSRATANPPQRASQPSKRTRRTRPTTTLQGLHRCPICTASFSAAWALTRHSAVHTKLRPHKCTRCPAGFSQLSALRSHEASVHDCEKPFRCRYCFKRFSQRCNRKQHLRRVHGIV